MVYPIIITVRKGELKKEVVKMDEQIWDLAVAIISVIFAKALDEGIQALKEKTSRRGKHTRRS